MKKILTFSTLLALFSLSALACEVKTESAYKDKRYGNYIIPVSVRLNQECVIIDFKDNSGRDQHMSLWRLVEKNKPITKNLYGKFSHEYKADGSEVIENRYVYYAKSTPGVEEVLFSAFPYGKEDRAVSYLITVE